MDAKSDFDVIIVVINQRLRDCFKSTDVFSKNPFQSYVGLALCQCIYLNKNANSTSELSQKEKQGHKNYSFQHFIADDQ